MHPQSVVHSMVEFTDGATIAQASPPDMRLPISLGLDWPHRVPGRRRARSTGRSAQTWTFEPLDEEAFPAVALAKLVGGRGGTRPRVFNAANEQAVHAFHAGRLRFLDIVADRGGARAVPEPSGTSTARPCSSGRAAGRRRARRPLIGSSPGNSDSLQPPVAPRRRRRAHVPFGVTELLYIAGVLVIPVGIVVSIGLHEVGHLVPAKLFGVRVTQYMIGFGKTVFSRGAARPSTA